MEENYPVDGNQIARQEFGATQLQAAHGLSDSAMAAQMQARIQARYIMAMRNPRDHMQVRARILNECKRTSFAKIAMYAKPVGGSPIVGLGIRFAEAAVRCMGNMDTEVQIIHDDATKRIIRVTVTDIQSNNYFTAEVSVEKTVERKKLKPNQRSLRSRINSYGDTVHLVEAGEQELTPKEGAAVSKYMRNCIMRHVPRDIQEEAIEVINEVLSNNARQDPAAERKQLCDAFADHNIMPADLEKYLGNPVDKVTTKQLVELRQIYSGIRQGNVSWAEVMEDAREESAPALQKPREQNGKRESVKEKLRKHNAKQEAEESAEEDAPPLSPENEEYLRQLREAEEADRRG